MLKIDPSAQARKFLKRVPAKHARQLYRKLTQLRHDPRPQDSKQLKGKSSDYLRADVGEYRIIYRVEGATLYVYVVGKRNDADVYRRLERLR